MFLRFAKTLTMVLGSDSTEPDLYRRNGSGSLLASSTNGGSADVMTILLVMTQSICLFRNGNGC